MGFRTQSKVTQYKVKRFEVGAVAQNYVNRQIEVDSSAAALFTRRPPKLA